MDWVFLSASIILEVLGTLSAKQANGFTNLTASACMMLFYGLSFTGLTIAMRGIEMSVAYPIWTGVAILSISVLDAIFYHEPITLAKGFSIFLMVTGLIGLTMGHKSQFLMMGIVTLIAAAIAWIGLDRVLRFSARNHYKSNAYKSSTLGLSEEMSFPVQWQAPPPTKQRNLLILLLLVVMQSLALLWTYRTAIAQGFTTATQTVVAFAQSIKLSQAQTAGCSTPPGAEQNRANSLQICAAMREVQNVPNGQFLYGGTLDASVLRSESLVAEMRLAHPGFRLRATDPMSIPPDSTTGIQMLLNGELSFAESQRSLREREYSQARDRGFTLKQVPVAMTGITFFVHPALNLPGLSLDQVQRIYTGKIDNWAEVGGPNLPITPVSQDADYQGSTLGLLLQDTPPRDLKLSAKVRTVRDATAALKKVTETPGAIGFGPQALVGNQPSIRLLGLARWNSQHYISPVLSNGQANKAAIEDGSYPLTQRIFVVIRQDGTLDESAGVAYANLLLSGQGQTLIDQAGYLPIRR
jgi:phosphate transport system substrate-binding protein